MIKYILILMMLIQSSAALTYNTDDPNFWDGWQRDTSVETHIINTVKHSHLSAEKLIKYAENDDAEYAFYLGLLYYSGLRSHSGIPFLRDHKKSLKYFQKVRKHGYWTPYVDYYIGMIYWHGYDGTPHNKVLAKTFLARANIPEAFLMLTVMNMDNPNEQLIWYKKLAYTDDWRAALTVAHWYNIGRGTPKNIGESYYWYNKACAQHIAFACTQLTKLRP